MFRKFEAGGCSPQRRTTSRALRLALFATALLGSTVVPFRIGMVAYAQNAQGSILGHVVDSTGAVIPGAQVTITNLGTNVKVVLPTNGSGDYVAPQLNPGPYQITVTAPGFSTESSSQLTLEVDQKLRQDFKLSVGSAASTVTVSADTQMLHTDDTTIGQVMDDKLIQALPVNGRDFTNLMLTNVGTNITPGGSGTDWSFHGLNNTYMEVSADGAQAQTTSYSVDGIYDADFFFSVPINIPNELSVQEFKMMNGMYGAQYGSGVSQVNVAIKSGTNQLHGAAYEALEANWLEPDNQYQAAENVATGSDTSTSPDFHQHQFGGMLSGPLVIPHVYDGRNKTFWFGSYDQGLYTKVNSPSTDFVPTAAELGGDFSAYPFPIYDPETTVANAAYNSNNAQSPTNSPVIRTQFANNQIPANRIDAVAANIAKYFDAANISSCNEASHILGGCDNYSANTKTTKNTGVGTARIDQYIGADDHVFLTANVGNLSQTSTAIRFGQGGQVYTRPKLFGGTWNHTFNPNLMNQATLGYSRDHFLSGPNTAYGPNLSEEAGLANTVANPATYDLPTITVFNYQGFGGGEPTTYADNIYQGVDTVTWLHGKHTFNFGVDYRRVQLYEFDNYDGTGSLTFNGEFTSAVPGYAGSALSSNGAYSSTAAYQGNALADMLLGDTSSAGGPPPIATDDYILWGNNWNTFFQDDWRVSDRLTINAGLRWERPANLHTAHNDGFAFLPGNGGQFQWANCAFTAPILAAGGNSNYLQCGASNTLVPVDNKDFAPRIGFSYRPDGVNDKLVVRGGFGIFYGTYNRYYDGSQYDKDQLYNEAAATYTTPTGAETESTAVVKNLWSAPLNADELFQTAAYEFPFNQVNWPKNHTPYDEQWSFDTEYQLTPSLMLDIGYVGDHGLRQPSQDVIGAATPPTVAGDSCNSLYDKSLATGTDAYCLSDPNFQPQDTRTPYANMPSYLYANINGFQSTYNALQVQLIERMIHGLTYHVNYTYSKTMDLTSGINLINGEESQIQDPHHPYKEYGLAGSDETHRLVATYAYEVPKDLIHVAHMNWLFAGWTTSGIYQLSSGFPFSIVGGVSSDQMSSYTGRFLANSTYARSSSFKSTLGQQFNTSMYSTPELGTYGNTNKSPERTPYFTNFDASFGKTTHIGERQALLIRAEYFNIGSTWHSSTSLLFPDSTVTDSNFGSLINKTYGNVSLWNPHTLQLTAQYSF
ncbi:carboxypeptidase-like regulatory domain-containing protein [Silvibacterium sp.]|uniref:carboxypeptidase-like regulatory domain-containing protein n=1 Tax=Silvibacterium sp. TaxID=1964179 RepID=UPI0039E4A887